MQVQARRVLLAEQQLEVAEIVEDAHVDRRQRRRPSKRRCRCRQVAFGSGDQPESVPGTRQRVFFQQMPVMLPGPLEIPGAAQGIGAQQQCPAVARPALLEHVEMRQRGVEQAFLLHPGDQFEVEIRVVLVAPDFLCRLGRRHGLGKRRQGRQ